VNVHAPAPGPAVEAEIARDLARRGAYAAPLALAAGALAGGWAGLAGAALALALVVANFLAGAALLTWAGRVSLNLLLVASVGGFFVRLAAITAIGLGVRELGWVHFPTFGIVLVVAHLGLLFWELRSVSLTLAYPGLRPVKEGS
jgi:hypothetical protein